MPLQDNLSAQLSPLAKHAKAIDHVAIAVLDLESAIESYAQMGFSLVERLDARGTDGGMISAIMTAGPVRFVLLQGTEDNSQVSRFIQEYGPGPQHIALEVEDCAKVCAALEEDGVQFSTSTIASAGLTQRFTARCSNSGVMLEFIERGEGREGFSQENVQGLFEELESKDLY